MNLPTSKDIRESITNLDNCRKDFRMPPDEVNSAFNIALDFLDRYRVLVTCIERMSSRQKRILKSTFNSLYGTKVIEDFEKEQP